MRTSDPIARKPQVNRICALLATDSTFAVCGEACNGYDAVEKAKFLHSDIVRMDVTMPGMNGLDATRQVKQLLPETRIIIVTELDAPEVLRQVLDAGAVAYVVKSRLPADLFAAIEKVVSERVQSTPTATGPGTASPLPAIPPE